MIALSAFMLADCPTLITFPLVLKKKKKKNAQSSDGGATALAVSWEDWDAGSSPGWAQWVTDLVSPQLRLRSRLQLGFDP